MLLTPAKKTSPNSDVENVRSYRIVQIVTHAVVYRSGECYSICPRCHRAIDREYIRFCSNCGQRLGWTGPISIDTRHPRMEAPRR